MAADDDRRTEPATFRRLQQARDQGKNNKSRDLATVLTLAAMLLAISMGIDAWVDRLRALVRLGLPVTRLSTVASAEPLAATVWSIAIAALHCMLPVLAIAVIAAVIAQAGQTGALIAPKALLSRISSYSVADNARRLIEPRNLIEAFKCLLNVVLLAIVLAIVIWQLLPTLIRLPLLSSLSLAGVMLQVLMLFIGLMLLGFAAVALFDAWYRRFDSHRALRMTRDEVKREQREQHGDPQVRGQQREYARQLLQETPLQRTVHASVVLCDASHTVAIAIFCERRRQARPWLINKGRGQGAQAILAVAREHDIRLLDDGLFAIRVFNATAIDADLDDQIAAQLNRML